MHELSIALALIEAASEERQRLGAVRIEALHVRIGQLAAVVPAALRFSFDLAAEGTAIAGARLEIESTPVVVSCATCGRSTIEGLTLLRCPRCEGTAELVSGRELELKALEVIDMEEPDDDGAHC
jgi:hydrogenase nickel incorporation protein HypA/HybF